MLRKVVCTLVILALSVGFAFADQFFAVITKVEGNKVTFHRFEGFGKDAKKGEEQTMKAAKDVKVLKGGKFNKDEKRFEGGEDIDDGLKNKMFTDIGEKGVRAMIKTDEDNKRIKEIRVLKGKGKKAKQ